MKFVPVEKKYVAMLDPGHGGKIDPGAVNRYTKESAINLTVAEACKSYLEYYPEIDVKMTRYQDTAVPLETRCEISNLSQANVYVSIHHNGGGGDGYEVYNYTGSVQGSKLANFIADEFAALGQNRRYVGSGLYAGTEPGDYFVLKHTNCPAALGEFGFMDTKDYTQFDERHELISIGRAYAKGILKYFDIDIHKDSRFAEDLTLEERVAKLEKILIKNNIK